MKTLCGGLLAGILLVAGCKKDNYDPPSSTLSGRVTYQNQPVSVRSFSSTNLGNTGTMLELYQKGYAFHTKIPVNVAQDGTYSAKVFDGDYQLVRSRGNGPWVDNTDTISVQVRGTTTMDVPVQPYYIVQNEKFQKSGTAITATVSVKQVITGKAVDRATLFLNSTQFVDVNNNVALLCPHWGQSERGRRVHLHARTEDRFIGKAVAPSRERMAASHPFSISNIFAISVRQHICHEKSALPGLAAD
jgi:hypothetical protein